MLYKALCGGLERVVTEVMHRQITSETDKYFSRKSQKSEILITGEPQVQRPTHKLPMHVPFAIISSGLLSYA